MDPADSVLLAGLKAPSPLTTQRKRVLKLNRNQARLGYLLQPKVETTFYNILVPSVVEA